MELQAADKTWSWFIMNDSYANLARLRLRGVILITSFGGDGSGCFRGLPGLPPVRVRPCCLAILSWAAS